jgi:hypothetical protein
MNGLPLPARPVCVPATILRRLLPGIRYVCHEPGDQFIRRDLFRVLDVIVKVGVGVGDLLPLPVVGKTRESKGGQESMFWATDSVMSSRSRNARRTSRLKSSAMSTGGRKELRTNEPSER